MNLLLKKAFLAGAAVAANRFVKFGADDNTVIVGAAATDLVIGASEEVHDVATGERIDVIVAGIADIKLGAGGATRGQTLGSDGTGQAVVVAATGNRIGGIAMASGVAGDVIPVLLSQGVL